MSRVLEIAKFGEPVLSKKAEPVINIGDSNVQHLIDDMLSTLEELKGLGLAAPQVHKSLQIIIISSRKTDVYQNAQNIPPTVMVNPKIIWSSDDENEGLERCLSVLEPYGGSVLRKNKILVEYISRDGKAHEIQLQDLAARVFQHEYDHLQGVVYTEKAEHILSKEEYDDYYKIPTNQ